MPVYAALIYTEDLDWSAPEQAETSKQYAEFGEDAGRPHPGRRRAVPHGHRHHGAGAGRPGRRGRHQRRPLRRDQGGARRASTCSSAPTSTRPSPSPPRSRARGTAPSRCAPSSRCEPADVERPDPLAEVVRVEGSRILAVLARTLGDLAARRGRRSRTPRSPRSRCGPAPARRTTPPRGSTWRPDARPSTCSGVRRDRPRQERDAVALAGQLDPELPAPAVVQDDLLRLLFTCCHPASSSTPGWRWPCGRCAGSRPPRSPACCSWARAR